MLVVTDLQMKAKYDAVVQYKGITNQLYIAIFVTKVLHKSIITLFPHTYV